MSWIYITLLLFAAGTIELVAGNFGVLLPALAVALFYACAVYPWERVLPAALLISAAHELVLGRHSGAGILLVGLVGAMAIFWARHGNCGSVPLQALPGAAAGFLWSMGLFLGEVWFQERFSTDLLRHTAWLLVQATAGAALLLPLVCLWLDALAERAMLPQYCRIQRRKGIKYQH
jgi:hypothetical protein